MRKSVLFDLIVYSTYTVTFITSLPLEPNNDEVEDLGNSDLKTDSDVDLVKQINSSDYVQKLADTGDLEDLSKSVDVGVNSELEREPQLLDTDITNVVKSRPNDEMAQTLDGSQERSQTSAQGNSEGTSISDGENLQSKARGDLDEVEATVGAVEAPGRHAGREDPGNEGIVPEKNSDVTAAQRVSEDDSKNVLHHGSNEDGTSNEDIIDETAGHADLDPLDGVARENGLDSTNDGGREDPEDDQTTADADPTENGHASEDTSDVQEAQEGSGHDTNEAKESGNDENATLESSADDDEAESKKDATAEDDGLNAESSLNKPNGATEEEVFEKDEATEKGSLEDPPENGAAGEEGPQIDAPADLEPSEDDGATGGKDLEDKVIEASGGSDSEKDEPADGKDPNKNGVARGKDPGEKDQVPKKKNEGEGQQSRSKESVDDQIISKTRFEVFHDFSNWVRADAGAFYGRGRDDLPIVETAWIPAHLPPAVGYRASVSMRARNPGYREESPWTRGNQDLSGPWLPDRSKRCGPWVPHTSWYFYYCWLTMRRL